MTTGRVRSASVFSGLATWWRAGRSENRTKQEQ
jgi:hypothetical protein